MEAGLHRSVLRWQCGARCFLARQHILQVQGASEALEQWLRLRNLDALVPPLQLWTLQELVHMEEEDVLDLCIDVAIKKNDRKIFVDAIASQKRLGDLLKSHGLRSCVSHFQAYDLRDLLRTDEEELWQICRNVGLGLECQKEVVMAILAEGRRAGAEVTLRDESFADLRQRVATAERAQTVAEKDAEALRCEVEQLQMEVWTNRAVAGSSKAI